MNRIAGIGCRLTTGSHSMHEQTKDRLFLEMTFKLAILDPIPANIAVLGPSGELLAVNLGGQKFADANRMADHSPTEKRWFALRAAPLLDYPSYVVASHEDISGRVLASQ